MKKINILFLFALMFAVATSKAQTTAMQFTGQDCNGNNVDLFADLDAGKAVVLFYYMPNCGACPPPARTIQSMTKGITAQYPGMVKGYAFPYQNVTTCAYSQSWVSSNNLSTLYTPMDSGASQVSYYGGFGMPTVVLVGGADHQVLFSTLMFTPSDTTEMKAKILELLGGSAGVNDLPSNVNNFVVYPNPTLNQLSVNLDLKETSDVVLDVMDITGKQVAQWVNEKRTGTFEKQFSTESLPNGVYFIRLQVNGSVITKKINIAH